MTKISFAEYMLQQKLSNLIFIFGFIFAVCAYSLWKPIETFIGAPEEIENQIFYIGIVAFFFCYVLAFFITKRDRWKWFPMFVYIVCAFRIVKEIWYAEEAQEYNLMDYAEFLVSAVIVFGTYIIYKYKTYLKKYGKTF